MRPLWLGCGLGNNRELGLPAQRKPLLNCLTIVYLSSIAMLGRVEWCNLTLAGSFKCLRKKHKPDIGFNELNSCVL